MSILSKRNAGRYRSNTNKQNHCYTVSQISGLRQFCQTVRYLFKRKYQQIQNGNIQKMTNNSDDSQPHCFAHQKKKIFVMFHIPPPDYRFTIISSQCYHGNYRLSIIFCGFWAKKTGGTDRLRFDTTRF